MKQSLSEWLAYRHDIFGMATFRRKRDVRETRNNICSFFLSNYLRKRSRRVKSPGERDGYLIQAIHKLFTSYVLIEFHACNTSQLQTI